MFFETPRTDGLLRGSRSERAKLMSGLGDEPWDLDTLLGLHLGLLDHADEVRIAAMEALWQIAQRKPDAIEVSPVALLVLFMHSFTVASRVALATFQCFVELDTAESRRVIQAVLESGHGSNNQFEEWVNILQASNKLEILRAVDQAKLSKTRQKMINRANAEE